MPLTRLALFALTAALGVVFLTAPPCAAKPLRIGYVPIADCLQLYVAVEQGYFAAEGLKIETRSMQGGPALGLAVEAGELEVGWSNMVSLFQAHARGFSFVLVAPGALEDDGAHLTHSLVVCSDSRLAGVGDLAGKTVAVNALGNVNELALAVLLAQAGKDPQDVRLVEVPFPDMEAALASNSVDAALLAEPFLSSAVTRGTRVLVAAPHAVFGRELLIAGWFAKAGWAEADPAQAAAFRRAVDKASAYITDHPQAMPDVLARFTRLTRDGAARMALPAYSPGLDMAALQRAIDLTAAQGFLPKPFPARDILARQLPWPEK